ncbi:MAG: UDP-N-acetylmuramoyl-L-alanyl-D-glutamate--2,6-diaminopimelate ligase [Ruminococcus sp.]|jgi:UDP-N-acetylmuramyl-tripeptide synthetase/UDP-N-acetylmuramoyl-tripeptide--D-alanyl-D-alanine ligase|nr:UDP-N-acetylmuramoyl-L-alanyl-D-glutamate--2,6-diaminopimelate ligase [Ruminococcus sp.]
MKFSDILKALQNYGVNIHPKRFDANFQVTGITDNSKLCKKGFIFVCIRGRKFDGHAEAAKMLESGAFAVVTDHDLGLSHQIIVPDTREFYGILCAVWFDSPDRRMKFIGVTGTNGKTTTTSLIAQILAYGGKTVGLIGTTGTFIFEGSEERKIPAPENTTPLAFELFEILARMWEEKVTVVVMEVSSFALDQSRIGPIIFDVSVFTNLTQDHLDYHETMESYYQAKLKLFMEHSRVSLINVNDNFGVRMYAELLKDKPQGSEVFAYGTAKNCQILIEAAKLEPTGTRFRMEAGGTFFIVTTNLVGEYNVFNAAAAIAAANSIGMGIVAVVKAISRAHGVTGRCEVIPCNRGFNIICDYAHTPDALSQVCRSLKKAVEGRFILLFGCGGNRDAAKRPLMGKAAEEFADVIVVTSDNPRDEDPELIIDQILDGMESSKQIIRIPDRRAAINYAISICKKGDLLLLAGKGHETYQILADGLTVPFDERKICADMLSRYTAPLPKPGGEGMMRLSELADCVNGSTRELSELTREFPFDSIFTDTRLPKYGGVYFALRGDNFDGRDFIPAATEVGAIASVTDRIYQGYPCIIVKNAKQALLDVAKYYRKRFSPITVAITGSVGKTTTKEMTALALSAEKTIFKTEGNYNNEIGVPKSLLNLNSSHTAAVVEMGMNHKGEISRMSGAVRPDICLITNIGFNHIEFFESQEDILDAKLEILDGAPKTAPLIINGNDKLLMTAKKSVSQKRKILTYGIPAEGEHFDYEAADIVVTAARTNFRVIKAGNIISDIELYMGGGHNVLNALAAIAVADAAGVDTAVAGQMLGCYQPLPLRGHIEKRGLNTVIVDCYNASVSSMEAALKMLADFPVKAGARRVAVLGDMLETGEHAKALHERVGEAVVENGIDLLVCYGVNAKHIANKADELGMHSGHSTDPNVIKNFLRFKLKPDDVILFKASRGMHLENLIEEYFS